MRLNHLCNEGPTESGDAKLRVNAKNCRARARKAAQARRIGFSMCGRFTHKLTWRQLHGLLNLSNRGATLGDEFDGHPLFKPSYNVAPTQTSIVVRLDGAGHAGPAGMKWGLAPRWASKFGPINARSDTVASLPTFRAAFKSRRCVVPATGFYEWQQMEGKAKQPWYISRADGQPLLFAGLWEENDTLGETFTIITTSANEFMTRFHDRMPVVLEPETAVRWMESPATELLRPASDGVLAAHRVSTRVNSPKNNDASLVEPAAEGTSGSEGMLWG
jgi:putative SOS response-associated peptidase YedK